jgi:lipoprotein-anchoring transpeptidase ErfK/SrfK
MSRLGVWFTALVLAAAASGCGPIRTIVPWEGQLGENRPKPAEPAPPPKVEKPPRPPLPTEVRAATPAAESIRAAALSDPGFRVLVSTDRRALWLMKKDSVIFAAPVAVGMHEPFTWAGKTYDFKTPLGRRKVIAKQENPLWVPPDWHYFEKAHELKVTPVQLKPGQVVRLTDSTRIEVRGPQVGRVNVYGNFWPFTPGSEIIFDKKIFIPPLTSAQRKVPEVLGTHKLEIGDGYLIHGTNEATSIGGAVSHGCVRMYNEDVAWLYERVPIGTPVYLF